MNRFLRLLVLSCGVALAGFAWQGSAAKKAPAPAKTEAKSTGQIDINSATEDELKTVSGIGDAYAKAIIKNRPYKGKNELVSKKVMPAGVYEKVKDHLVARQK